MTELRQSHGKKDRPRSSQVYFFDDIPQIASCKECTVLIPQPNIFFKENKLFFRKKKISEQTLFSFGQCIILLLEYSSNEDVVNFTAGSDQVPSITINLNRIIDKSLNRVVKDSKIWQEFHLNDSGKKRSFVLHFQKGKEFDEFSEKLEEVIKHLHACRKGKSSVDKKYYLVGFKEEKSDQVIEEAYLGEESTQSSNLVFVDDFEKPTDKVSDSNDLAPPFSPIPYSGLSQKGNTLPQTSRVTGLEEAISQGLPTRSKSERKPKYHEQIYGSLQKPFSVHSILNSEDETPSICLLDTVDDPAWTVVANPPVSDIDGNKTIKNQPNSRPSSDSGDCYYSIDISEIDANSNTTDLLQTLNIQDIGNSDLLQTVNIKDIGNSDLLQTVNIKDIGNSDLLQTVNIKDIGNSDLLRTFINRDIDKNRTLTSRDCVQSVNIVDICSSDDDEPDVVNGDDTIEMKARQEQNQLKQYAQLLQAAINDGDQENARQYADFLAASHVKVTVTVDENSLKVETNDLDIKIKVFIEDKETMGGSLLLNVKLTDTIGDLKAKMFFKHKFPIEIQKWIVGKRIPKDEETLHKLKVTNGQSVYLYLVSAKSVGLDKQQHLAASGYTDMTIPEKVVPQIAPMSAHNAPQPQNQLSPAPPTQPRAEKIEPTMSVPPVLKAPASNYVQVPKETTVRQEPDGSHNPKKKQAPDTKQIGWQCPVCTFLNLPTRPGCEMCSHPRPKEYKVPENYQMSKEEIERIKREKEDERKAQQADAERRAREREPAENIYNQMTEQEIHQLLTLNDQMQQQILQSRQTGGQEHEFNEGVQIPRGGLPQQENLENIPFTLQPGQQLDFSQENDDSV